MYPTGLESDSFDERSTASRQPETGGWIVR